jgi:two-component system, OmpR family, heavy metal sensor histidine kinase CusS
MMLARPTLTARLTVLFTGVVAAVLLGLGVLVAWATARHFVELDRHYLADKIHLIDKLVAEADRPPALRRALDELLDSHTGLYVQVWRGTELLYGHGALTAGVAPKSWAMREVREWAYEGRVLRGFADRLEAVVPVGRSPGARQDLWVVAAVDTAHHTHFLASMRQTLALYLIGAAVLCAVLAWWAARRGLAPLKVMRERAMSITAHNLQQRMPAEAVPVELAELAQRRSADDYRDVLASNAEEFERLARMVSDMLFLAKTENGIDLPHRERIRLHHEVQALFDFYEAVAEENNIRLALQGQADMDGDRLMVRRALSNLLSNALRHADTGSVVEVRMAASGDGVACTTVRLDVINHGPAIASDDIPRLFERFYRADRSRAHPAAEGAGLGLAITKAIVEAHGGRIEVVSAAGRTCFSVIFA